MSSEIGALQFLRPAWLAGLLLVPLCGAGWWHLRQRHNPWLRNVDAHLLPGLLEHGTRGLRWLGPVGAMVAAALAVVALAGPSWRTAPQPLQAGGTPLVVAWQLSDSTRAGDLPPSRLLQARARIAGILRARGDNGVGLVAYADDAFVVAPLTDDPANIVLFLDALSPDVMPKEGNRPDRAIDLATELLRRAGVQGGDILLVADGAGAQAVAAAGRAAASGIRVSTLGMGRAGGTLFRRGDGGLAQAQFDPASLQATAAAGGGIYRAWDAAAGEPFPGMSARRGHDPSTALRDGARVPLDGGYWLLLPLLALVLLVFRRGAGMAVLVACLVVPWHPASAQAGAHGTAWRRPDQVAHARDLEAESAYRRGAFADAARAWARAEGADADYNRGNALARAGRYEDAIAAYDEALRARPGMADAAANRAAVQAALQRRPPPGPRDGSRGNQKDAADGSGRPRDRPDAAKDGSASGGEDRPEDGQGQPGGAVPPRAPARPPAAGKPETGGASDSMAAAGDPARQRQADAAQRAAMDAALGRAPPDSAGEAGDAHASAGTAAERERRQASEAWLQRIPDDPGGLLRTRFRLEHERRQRAGRDELP